MASVALYEEAAVAFLSPPVHPPPGHRVLQDGPEKFLLQVTLKLNEILLLPCIPKYAAAGVKLLPTATGTF